MKPHVELTAKQEKVLKFIRERVGERLPPTIREIAGEIGVSSTGTVRDYLAALQKKGYLKRTNNKSRAIELLDSPNKIPIISSIAAGQPKLAYEDTEGYVEIARENTFALKVKGESMIDAGIMDGDIAVIRKQKTADNGDIIAALLDNNEVTLKKLKIGAGKPFLEAANKKYPPIHKDFSIIGKLVNIVRKY
ncbi:MAG: transcriptional repressor LexA [Candidatus Omnitrophota bacterium]|jgi:repressor LexA